MREATVFDTERLIAWMRELWLTDAVPFNETLSRQGLAELLANRSLGRVWIFEDAGYLVLTFGFSLEFGGRDAFIDEFFIAAPHRGKGLGSAMLDQVAGKAANLGVNAIHLEVADTNERAEALYTRLNFRRHHRRLMTRWLNT